MTFWVNATYTNGGCERIACSDLDAARALSADIRRAAIEDDDFAVVMIEATPTP